jgi:PilZ domain-containing protein
MNAGLAKSPRRAVRRAARSRCNAVSSEHFELLGERVLDLSPRGMLVACDLPVALGEEVIVSFQTPGRDPIWLDAEAEIARIVHGFRQGDPGYCVGLRFTYFERLARGELLSRLAGVPPPIPQRRPEGCREHVRLAVEPAVLMRPVLRVSPARGACPAGVFYA